MLQPQSEDGTLASNGSEFVEKITGIKRGALYPYLNEPKVYHCRGDKRIGKPPEDTSKTGKGAYRSYSIAGGMFGRDPVAGGAGIIPVTKQTKIKTPDSKYVFVEEMDGRDFNMGSWIIWPNTQAWIDPGRDMA